jgi:hypothetical protein
MLDQKAIIIGGAPLLALVVAIQLFSQELVGLETDAAVTTVRDLLVIASARLS